MAAAVVLHRHDFSVRIDDSKRLTAASREHAYREILARGRVGVGLASHELIDRINIRQAARAAMADAVRRLGAPPELLLVDGTMPSLGLVEQVNIVGGDRRSLSIACASIVAKVVRDRIMAVYDRRFPGYAFARHKGYGTSLHAEALQRLGPAPIHRRTFAPVRRLLESSQPAAAR